MLLAFVPSSLMLGATTSLSLNVAPVPLLWVLPLSLYLASEGVEVNEFKRTSSRLIEMGSESYLALPHGNREQQLGSGSREGLIET